MIMFKSLFKKITLLSLVVMILSMFNPDIIDIPLNFEDSNIALASGGQCIGENYHQYIDNANECWANGGQWVTGTDGYCAGENYHQYIKNANECWANGGQWIAGGSGGSGDTGRCAGDNSVVYFKNPHECVANGGQWITSDIGRCAGDNSVIYFRNANECVANGGQWISDGGSTGGGSEETPGNGGSNGGSSGGGGSNHTVINRGVNVVIDTGGLTTGTTSGKNSNSKDNNGKGLGEVVDYETKKPFQMYFTNIPSSNTMTTDSSPIIGIALMMNDTFIELPKKPNSKGSYGNSLDKAKKDFDSLVNSLTLHLYDLNKVTKSHDELLTLTESNEGKVTELTLSSKESLSKEGWLKIPNSGYYAVVVEVHSKSQDPTTTRMATSFKLDKIGEFKALPIKNRLNAFTENKNLMEGKLNNSHNLNLTFDTLDSLKVPAIYDYKLNQYLIGSLNGGLKLFNSNMEQIQLDQQTICDSINVSQIVEVSESKYLVSTLNSGVYIVNGKDKTVDKIDGVNDIKNNGMISDNIIVITTDEDLKVYKFQNKTGELALRTSLTARDIFNSDNKLGEVSRVGDKLIVNSLYNQNNSKVAVVSL